MGSLDRPQLRRRSQSEQVVPTKATFPLLPMPNKNEVITSGAKQVLGQSRRNNAQASGATTVCSSIIPQAQIAVAIPRDTSLPPKPDQAVIAAAAKAVTHGKKGRRHVFFSTPTSRRRQSPPLASEQMSFTNSTASVKSAGQEPHLPPPPYTPARMPMTMDYLSQTSRGYDYACTPDCNTIRHIPGPAPPAPSHVAHFHPASMTTIFPSVIAASEALRINLGLAGGPDSSTISQPYYNGPGPLTMSLQRSPSIPGLQMPLQMQGPVIDLSAVPRGYTNNAKKGTMQTVQHKVFMSIDPQPGQIQPLTNMSPNLPPVVNTGHKGPMKVQPGDWSCLVCSFVNWRRRRFCMRCCPFAEGNASLPPAVLASMASAQNPLYALSPQATRPAYPVYATPPRTVPPRTDGLLRPMNMMGPYMHAAPIPGKSAAYSPMMYGCMPGGQPLASPFGPVSGHSIGLPSMPPSNMPSSHIRGASAQLDMNSPAFTYCPGAEYIMQPSNLDASSRALLPQQVNTHEGQHPLTPSPNGSHSSGASFGYSDSSPLDSDSPTTSINSDGTPNSLSSPRAASKALRTPPSKFKDFDAGATVKVNLVMTPITVDDTITGIEHRLDRMHV